jgi:hypothetical protein
MSEANSSTLADVVDRADVGVVQRRSSPNLSLESAQCLPIHNHMVRQELKSCKAVEVDVFGLIHHTHPPLPRFLTMR